MPVSVCDVPATVTPTFVPGPPSMNAPAPATASHVSTTVPSAVCRAVKFAGSFAEVAVIVSPPGTADSPPPVVAPETAFAGAAAPLPAAGGCGFTPGPVDPADAAGGGTATDCDGVGAKLPAGAGRVV